MKIIVLVKQVPDITGIKIDKVTNTLIREGVENIINPDDLAGIEEALRLKEMYGGSVSAVTMGPVHAEKMMKELYAMGVDHCYLLTDRKFAGSDTWSTSKILSSFIQTLDYDLIIAGYQAIDGDTAQVGPQVAAFLDIPQATYLKKIIKIEDHAIYVEKVFEDEIVTLKVCLPALVTTLKEMNTPRFMNAFDIWDKTDQEVKIITFEDLDLDASLIGLQGSPTRVKKTYTKPVMKKGDIQALEPKEAALVIADLILPHIEVKK